MGSTFLCQFFRGISLASAFTACANVWLYISEMRDSRTVWAALVLALLARWADEFAANFDYSDEDQA